MRAATKTSSSDVSSGGIDSSTTDPARIRPAAAPPGRDPLTMPSGRPTSVAIDQRRHRQDGGVGGALRDEIGHRPVVGERAAEVEAHRADEPVAVLIEDRPIEPVLRAHLREALAVGADPERVAGVVARRQPRQQERPRRHGEHQRRREQEPPEQIGEHALLLCTGRRAQDRAFLHSGVVSQFVRSAGFSAHHATSALP